MTGWRAHRCGPSDPGAAATRDPGWALGAALVAAAFGFMAATGHAGPVETGVYPAPDSSMFLLISEEDGDGDGDGVDETHIRHYRNVAGDSLFSMTTKGRLWAWSLESHGAGGSGETDAEHDYVIRDSDCDGAFDERYGLDEEFHVPDCLR